MTTNPTRSIDPSSLATNQADESRKHAPKIATAMAPDVLDRLVYLVGCPRGGTSIIANSFYLSDRVLSFPGPTLFTQNVWRYRNKLDRRTLQELFKRPKYFRQTYILRSLDAVTRRNVEGRIRDAFDTAYFADMYQIYPLLYSLSPAFPKDRSKLRCWADKAVQVYGLFDIARFLPKAKIIFIIRDPRATVASMKSQTVRSRGEEGSSQASLTALLASSLYWRNMMQTILRFSRRYPDRVMFLHYEDFVLGPEESINRALEFATGERMSETDLQFGLAQFPHKRKHEKKQTPKGQNLGIDREPLERWRRLLDDGEIELVTALTWRTARKLGYDIDPPYGRFSALKALRRLKDGRKRTAMTARLAYTAIIEPFVRSRTRRVPTTSVVRPS